MTLVQMTKAKVPLFQQNICSMTSLRITHRRKLRIRRFISACSSLRNVPCESYHRFFNEIKPKAENCSTFVD